MKDGMEDELGATSGPGESAGEFKPGANWLEGLSLVGKWPGENPDEDGDPDDDEAVPEVTAEFSVLNKEEIADLRARMFSAGVYEFWNVRQSIAQRIHDTASRLSGKYIAREEKELGEDEALRRLQAREEEVEALRELVNDQLPPWQQISGIATVGEHFENPNQRAAGIRRLLSGIERLLRYELKHSRAPQEKSQDDGRWLDRSFQWDPLRVICLQYQIAQHRLSGFSKELTGRSALELVDTIRAEKVREVLKAELKSFVAGFMSQRKDAKTQRREGTERWEDGETRRRGENGDLRTQADEIYAELKSSRRGGRFHRSTWAASMGFSSYQKFFRACLMCYGLTPHQLEIALIEEILGDGEKNGSHEEHEEERKGHEEKNEENGEEIMKRE